LAGVVISRGTSLVLKQLNISVKLQAGFWLTTLTGRSKKRTDENFYEKYFNII